MPSPAYPPDLAAVAFERWPTLFGAPMPITQEQLAEALDECFHASLLTEEGRPARFRLLLAPEEDLPLDGEPNREAWRLAFESPMPLNAQELRRLSPAAPFERTLIAASPGAERMEIWGLAHSGADWLAPSWGGRRDSRQPWTSAPIIHVNGPGRLAVRGAGQLVAALERGRVTTQTIDAFESEWLGELFANARGHLTEDVRAVDPTLLQTVSQHMVRRTISLIRSAGHGGLVLFADPEVAERYRKNDGALRTKHRFRDVEPVHRYQTLIARLSSEMKRLDPRDDAPHGWREFEEAEDKSLARVERSIFEMSNVVAALASVDGAVLLDKRFGLVGFGVEVSAELEPPSRVWRAYDLEATERRCDLVESVGTRHRAAYRYLQHHPEGLAIVISQDGSVRFVAHRPEGVTYWEQFVSP